MEEEKKVNDNKSDLERKPKDSHKPKEEEGFIPEEILDEIPAEDKSKIISIQTMFSGLMKRTNPLADKITEEHIHKLIDNADKQDLRNLEERKDQRKYNFLIFIISLIFLGFIIVYLKEDKEMLYRIIIAIISFLGGFGFGRTTIKKED
jgi:hypothetical protein